MTAGLRALLAGVFDYAGLFPPAELPLAEAVSKYVQYRREPDSWMLRNFVVPAGKLGEAAESAGQPIPFSVLGADGIPENLAGQVQALELKAIPAVALPFDIFLELSEVPADFDAGRFGLKCRTGGLNAAAFPAIERLAQYVVARSRAGQRWKATAGLHHPVRMYRDEVGTKTHGFLNLLVAVVLTDVHQPGVDVVSRILAEESAGEFLFRDDGLRWGELSATVSQIEAVRERRFVSIGSCSFDEPRDDLKSLGLM